MKDYYHFTKEELIDKLTEKDSIISALKAEMNKGELLNFPWIGNLGNWHWNIKEDIFVYNEQKLNLLNYSKDVNPTQFNFSFFTDKLHPDHYEDVTENMRNHLSGKSPVYEVEYKIATQDGDWKWHYDTGIVTKRDEHGQPTFMAGIVLDISKEKQLGRLIEQQNERLIKMAHTDYLTGILNRRALFEKLELEIDKATEHNTPLSVLLIDVDNFKTINDNYGHLAGDRALVMLTDIIKKNLTPTDFVGRYGGEEFLLVFPQKTQEESYVIAETIRKEIENLEITDARSITISGGIKEYNSKCVDVLIDDADTALYRAKNNGKNQIIFGKNK